MATKKTAKRAKRKVSKAKIVLLVGIAIILIPCLIFGWILLSAYLKTGTPIVGNRYENDLNPQITSEQLKQVESNVKGINGVENCNVELTTATMRVYADVNDSYGDDQVAEVANQVYNTVNNTLSVGTYFTRNETEKMYDLEIHVYNLDKNRDQGGFSYVILNKNSNMEEPRTQVVSKALDEELAQRLRDDVEAKNNPTPTPDEGDLTLGGEEPEATPEPEATEETTEGE
ncbi:MAG: hypothetical protein HUJ57_06490 [Erysipelotrichaceae bacterium]|nr:hypothetical protein [Erysipelotrichaceae bacterium]